MQIIPYETRFLSQLTQLINRHVQQIPPAWILTEKQVTAILDTVATIWNHLETEIDMSQVQTQVLCAVEGDELLAAVQWYYFDGADEAHLAWIFGKEKANETETLIALLERVIQDASTVACRAIETGRLPFSVGWYCYPSIWQPIIYALHATNFQLDKKWLIMTRDPAPIPAPQGTSIPDMELHWEIDAPDGEWNLFASTKEEPVGACHAWAIPQVISEHKAATRWVTIEWLHVEDDYRRRGVGQLLLLRQMQYQARRGVEHFILWTEVDNVASRQLYHNMGFTDSQECWTYQRDLP